jgi:hypothetical protein
MPVGRAANPDSVINTLLRRIRFYLDEPEDDKYTDNDLLDLVVPPAIQEVWGYMHNTSDNPIIASFSISVTTSTTEYILPPSVQAVHQLVRLDSNDQWVYEYRPNSKAHTLGPNWFIEGNILRWEPKPIRAETLVLMYTPVPDQPPSYGTGTLAADLTTLTLASNAALGFRDKRVNGYVGAVLRLIHDDGIETRIISAYDPSTRQVTVRHAFTVEDAGSVTYEIFPIGSAAFTEAIALSAVLKLGAARGLSAVRTKHFMDLFRQARRTETQRLTNMMARRGKHIDKRTRDNPDAGLQGLYGPWWVY